VVAHRFEHETEGVEPERGEVGRGVNPVWHLLFCFIKQLDRSVELFETNEGNAARSAHSQARGIELRQCRCVDPLNPPDLNPQGRGDWYAGLDYRAPDRRVKAGRHTQARIVIASWYVPKYHDAQGPRAQCHAGRD
jgi:hypothetical protein